MALDVTFRSAVLSRAATPPSTNRAAETIANSSLPALVFCVLCFGDCATREAMAGPSSAPLLVGGVAAGVKLVVGRFDGVGEVSR